MHVLRLCSVFESPETALGESWVRFDPVGGMQNHTGGLSRALDRFGIRQTILTTRPPTAPPEAPLGRHGRVIRIGGHRPYCRQFYALHAGRRLPGLLGGIDVVHAHLGEDIAITPLALHAASAAAAPLVLTIHTSLRHTLRPSGPRSLLLKTLGAALESHGLTRADAVIVLTERMRNLLRRDTYVIPSGLDPGFTLTLDAGPGTVLAGIPHPRVLYLGRLHPQKGVDILLRAFALLDAPAHLVIAGDGPARTRLRNLSARLGIADRTRFLGFVPHERVPALLRAADLLVLPSRYEELGSVLLEAMRAGIPAIASRVGGIPELIVHRDTGLLVPPGSPPALAAAIRQLINDRTLAADLAASARKRAGGYEWDTLARRVLDVYRTVGARR